MTAVLLVGTGAVGTRAARQLADTPGVDRVLVAGRSADRARALATAVGGAALDYRPGDDLPEGVDAVAVAAPAPVDAAVAAAALEVGASVASVADGRAGIGALLSHDDRARSAGVTVAAGCGLAPGLADVLARHAADALQSVDEVDVARSAVAGRASRSALRRERRERVVHWRDGEWREEHRPGAELVWFPEPIGVRECQPVALGVELLVRAFPELARATVRVEEPPRATFGTRVRRAGLAEGWGATRVEVWGHRNGARAPVVYGAVDRTAVAAGTVLAVISARLAGALPALSLRAGVGGGVLGLAALVEPVPFLGELARRGVKAAVFEGVPVG